MLRVGAFANCIKSDITGLSVNCIDGSSNLVQASYFRMVKGMSNIQKGKDNPCHAPGYYNT